MSDTYFCKKFNDLQKKEHLKFFNNSTLKNHSRLKLKSCKKSLLESKICIYKFIGCPVNDNSSKVLL